MHRENVKSLCLNSHSHAPAWHTWVRVLGFEYGLGYLLGEGVIF